MSWDYVCDESGELEVIVSRWYNQQPPKGHGNKEVRLVVDGFIPNEPVQVEIYGADEEE